MTADDVPDLYPSEPLPVRLMNTVWASRSVAHDSLATVAQLQQWARQCGIRPATGLTRADLTRARSLRDALRRLAATVLEDRRPNAVRSDWPAGQALDVLNDFLRTSVPEVVAGDDNSLHRGWHSSATGFDRELVAIALEGSDLLAEGATRLGVCHGPGCVLYFERQARREWCSAGCGNRARVARHYHRHRSGASGEAQASDA
ncbi:MAG: ABATE domain-containing protein [Actinomycetota bacterium]|nr:ABATE domain-containing protein [Actinomycetota bacterium]